MRVLNALPLLLVVACGGDDPYTEGGGLRAQDYYPVVDAWMRYGPKAAPADGPYLMVEVSASSWELRQGTSWADHDDTEVLDYAIDDGLELQGSLLLPPELSEGDVQDGVEILSITDEQVYYGTFNSAARTSIPDGRFAGEWIFAPVVGPIQIALDGEIWELVYYL